MLPHTVTLFNFVGENEGTYQGDYEITILKNVMCIPKDGAVLSTTGTTADNDADLYIFKRNVIATDINGNAKRYISPDKWDESQHKEKYWTLHDNGTDIFIKGLYSASMNNIVDTLYNDIVSPGGDKLVFEYGEELTPDQIQNSYLVKGVVDYDMGLPRMRHWEVFAR